MDEQEVVAGGLDIDEDIPGPPRHRDRRAGGVGGGPEPDLGGGGGLGDDLHPGAVAARGEVEREALVRLLQDQAVGSRVRADRMEPQLVLAPGVVHAWVEQEPSVGGPGQTLTGPGDALVQDLSGGHVLDDDGPSLVPEHVSLPGDAGGVGGGGECAQAEELPSAGLHLLVDEQLLTGQWYAGADSGRHGIGGGGVHGDTVVGGIGVPLGGAREVPPVALADGDAGVGLLGVGPELGDQLLGEGARGGGDAVRPGVLGLEMGEDLRVLLVPQPLPGVREGLAVEGTRLPGTPRSNGRVAGDRRCGHGGGLTHGQPH